MRVSINNKKQFMVIFNKMFPENKIKNINGITIDSRKIMENDLFVPLKGAKFDGYNFINQILKIKGTIALNDRNSLINNKRIIPTQSNKNTLLSLAKEWRKIINSKIISITGSNGKTTTKDLLFHILNKEYKCSKSNENFNSCIGLPLTFLNCKLNDDYTILELGANQPGEIETLCQSIKPDYSLITNISNAHIKNFRSINEIVYTKSAIFQNLSENGIAFIILFIS